MSPKCGKQKSPRLSFHMSSRPTPCSVASQRESVYLLPCLVRVITFITLIYSVCKTPQAEEQPSAATSPRPEPKQSPWPKRQHSSTDSQGDTSIDETSPKALQEGPLSSKRRETADWFASLKPSCADAFSHDSDPIKEARSHYFATHPWDWINGNTDNISDIFRELAEGADLLGNSIYELQLSWEGPEELKHTNYSHRSLPKGFRFLRVVPTMESPKITGLKGIHNPDALWHFVGCTYCP